MTDEKLMDIARPFAADGGRWPSDWLDAMRAAMAAQCKADASMIRVMSFETYGVQLPEHNEAAHWLECSNVELCGERSESERTQG